MTSLLSPEELPVVLRSALLLIQTSKLRAWEYAELLSIVAPRYKRYLASFALIGDPNHLPFNPAILWPVSDGSNDKFLNVMDVEAPSFSQRAFKLGSDDQNSRSKCDFWVKVANRIQIFATEREANIHSSQQVLVMQDSGQSIDLFQVSEVYKKGVCVRIVGQRENRVSMTASSCIRCLYN